MRTKLPEEIKTVAEAKKLLKELYINGESFHPEDDANNIVWNKIEVSETECSQLNKLMNDIYKLSELKGYPDNINFDPCGYYLFLEYGNEFGWDENGLLINS